MAAIDFYDKKDEYISLKEAAEISGYAPDYIGQLIRKGKLSGKQVYSNVAWVTTATAVRAYLSNMEDAKSTKSGHRLESGVLITSRRYLTRLWGELEAVTLYKSALYAVIGLSVLFSLMLFFVFAVSFDSWVSRKVTADRVIPVVAPVVEQSPL